MSEVSKVSFGSGFHVKFKTLSDSEILSAQELAKDLRFKIPTYPKTFEQKQNGAEYLLKRITKMMNNTKKIMHEIEGCFDSMVGSSIQKLYCANKIKFILQENNNILKFNNSNIEVNAFEIVEDSKKHLTVFVIQDKKNRTIDIFGVNKDCLDKTVKANVDEIYNDVFTGDKVNKAAKIIMADKIDPHMQYSQIDVGRVKSEVSFYKALDKLKNILNERFSRHCEELCLQSDAAIQNLNIKCFFLNCFANARNDMNILFKAVGCVVLTHRFYKGAIVRKK